MNLRAARWILIGGMGDGAGEKSVASALAREWSGRFPVLVWDVSGLQRQDVKTVGGVLPYSKDFSPELFRNFLRQGETGYSSLIGALEADPSQAAEFLSLLSQSFSFVIAVSPPTWDTAYLQLLEQTHLSLLIAKADSQSLEPVSSYFKMLGQHTFPKALAQLVLTHAPSRIGAEFAALQSAFPTFPLAALSPVSFDESIRSLLKRLDREDLYCLPHNFSADAELKAKTRIHGRLLEAASLEPSLPSEQTRAALETFISEEALLPASRETRGRMLKELMQEVTGLGALEPLLQDAEVSEIMVNGPKAIFVEKKGRLYASDAQFENDAQLRTFIDRIVSPLGRRVDESSPLCDARLADGSRVNIVLPPLALDGPTLTIRKFMQKRLGLTDLIELGALSKDMAGALVRCVEARKNILISGGTGSGKTTLLNILSSFISPDERIVTIEDAAELKLQQPHVVRLESRPPNAEGQGAISIRRLVINALRMRPDRIVVGECRGGEALDMLQAMNTGHDGSLTTLHANTPRDALGRLEALVLMAGIDLPIRVIREQIKSAVHLIIQIARLPDGRRKITSITELTGMEGDVLTTSELYRYRAGQFESTGVVSQFILPR